MRDDAWKPYIRAKVVHDFWDERMGTEVLTVMLAGYHPSLVVGAPALVFHVIPADTDDIAQGALTPEQARDRSRSRALRRLRTNLNRCLARFLGCCRALRAWFSTCRTCKSPVIVWTVPA
jgi:hypothetical protein